MMRLSSAVPVLVGLLSISLPVCSAHQQMSVKSGEHQFKLTRFNDWRKAPYRVYFWDAVASGSTYRFGRDGTLLFFKAGSRMYSDLVWGDDGILQSHSVQNEKEEEDESAALSLVEKGGSSDYDPFTCDSASYAAAAFVCGVGLHRLCDSIPQLSLDSEESVASVNILCASHSDMCNKMDTKHIDTCESAFPACTGGDATLMANFVCDGMNNNPECGYDGGDCGLDSGMTSSVPNFLMCEEEHVACFSDEDCLQCIMGIGIDQSCCGFLDDVCHVAGETCRDNGPFVDIAACMGEDFFRCPSDILGSNICDNDHCDEQGMSSQDSTFFVCEGEHAACEDDADCHACLAIIATQSGDDDQSCCGFVDDFCHVVDQTCRENGPFSDMAACMGRDFFNCPSEMLGSDICATEYCDEETV